MKRSWTLAVASLALLVTACSSDGTGTDDANGSTDASRSEGYPATVSTAFGDVTIEDEPVRVVALGWGDAETVLSLGGQPVGASDWLGFGEDGVGPWLEDAYNEAPVIIETLEPSYEEIAALEPDLILDTKSSGEQERYDRLSAIAPTVGIPEGGESYLTTTDQQVELIATAMGDPAAGETLLSDLDADIDAAASNHPEWEGMSVTAANKSSEGWGAYVDGTARVEFLTNLGFVQNSEVASLEPNSGGFSVDISGERLDLLDADLLVAFPIFIETTEITEDPLWQEIPAVADGHSIVIDGDLSSAYALGTVAASEYALAGLVPLIEDATASE